MSEGRTDVYKFGDFRLDTGEKELRRSSGEVLTIPPKAFDLLLFFVENPGRLLEKNLLMDKVWADSFVEEGNLKIHVHTLRKILNENGKEFIETVPRRGYRFSADVRSSSDDLIVEKITRSKLVIEETGEVPVALPASRSRTRAIAAGVLTLLALTMLGYFFVIRPRIGTMAAVEAVHPTTIAVLPFRSLTQDENDKNLGIGLTDALITKLSRVQHLVVRPTSAVLTYVATPPMPQKIGPDLKVEAYLDGTIQRFNDRLRISLQLISSADSHVMWAGSFEQEERDLFKFQDAFSEEIANALQYKVPSDELAALKRLDTDNPEAYRLYLNARYYFSQGKTESLLRAADLYAKATALDDKYALAFAGTGECYMMLGESSFEVTKPAEAYANAIAADKRALELDPTLAEAHAVLGNIQAKHLWDIPASEASYRRAIELNPNYGRVHELLGWSLIREGRFDEADAEFRRAGELDPTSLATATNSGYPAFFAGDYDRAILLFQEAVDRDKNFWGARMNLWRGLHHAGRRDESMTEIRAAERIVGPGVPVVEMAIGRTYALEGKTEEARNILNKLVARKEKGEFISPLLLAALAADLDDRDAVFNWLDECITERDDYMPFLRFAPEFTKYHDEPRFQELVARVKPLV